MFGEKNLATPHGVHPTNNPSSRLRKYTDQEDYDSADARILGLLRAGGCRTSYQIVSFPQCSEPEGSKLPYDHSISLWTSRLRAFFTTNSPKPSRNVHLSLLLR